MKSNTVVAGAEMKDRVSHWTDHFDLREFRLIQNCQEYAKGDPAGLPGHQLMLIVAKMAELLLPAETGDLAGAVEGGE